MAAQPGDKLYSERVGIPGRLSVQDILALVAQGGGATRRICQIRPDTATDINNVDWAEIAIGGTVDFNHTDYTPQANGIVCNFTDSVKATLHLKQSASSQRTSVNCRLAVAGAVQGPVGASSYIRNSGGHNASSTGIPGFELAVTDGDLITVETIREAGAGVVTMDAGASYLLLERWA